MIQDVGTKPGRENGRAVATMVTVNNPVNETKSGNKREASFDAWYQV